MSSQLIRPQRLHSGCCHMRMKSVKLWEDSHLVLVWCSTSCIIRTASVTRNWGKNIKTCMLWKQCYVLYVVQHTLSWVSDFLHKMSLNTLTSGGLTQFFGYMGSEIGSLYSSLFWWDCSQTAKCHMGKLMD